MEVSAALADYGLLPTDVTQRQDIEQLVDRALLEGEGCISFTGFLQLIRRIRERSRLYENERLKRFFSECDKDNDGFLSFAEASSIFSKLGLTPQCREHQDEMKNLLLRVDVDNSGDLDFKEFQVLVQHITESKRANQRNKENATGTKLGFSQDQVTEIREIFKQLDAHSQGTLGIIECRKLLTLLRVDMSAEELKGILDSISTQQRVDLEGFMAFLQKVGKDDRCPALAESLAPQLRELGEDDQRKASFQDFQKARSLFVRT